jgi:hypothetical protein
MQVDVVYPEAKDPYYAQVTTGSQATCPSYAELTLLALPDVQSAGGCACQPYIGGWRVPSEAAGQSIYSSRYNQAYLSSQCRVLRNHGAFR